MKIVSSILVAIALCILVFPAHAQGETALDLNEYRWENRLLIAFAVQENSPAYVLLSKEIETLRDEFEDRDMVFISVFEKGPSTAGDLSLSQHDTDRLRQQFDVEAGVYRVFLIGKDGGTKRAGGRELRVREIFRLIDTMPMRRQEMRDKATGR